MTRLKTCLLVICIIAAAARNAFTDQPAPASATAATARRVWLTDLPEHYVKVGWGHFGKHGQAGFEDGAFTTQDVSCEHGLGTHADSHVEYVLGKKYRTFRATAAMSDTSKAGQRPIEFRVLGDRKLLWQSYGMNGPDNAQPCLLDITGVDLLTLEARYRPTTKGDNGWAHSVWVDPYVATDAPSPAALALCDPQRFQVFEKDDALERQLKELFKKEDFAQLEKVAQGLRERETESEGRYLQGRYYETLAQELGRKPDEWRKHLERLERWRKAQPDSPVPVVLLGMAWRDQGWQIRGGGFAGTVAPASWPKFQDCLKRAREYLETAAKNKIVELEVYPTLISISMAQGRPLSEVAALLEKGMKLDRGYLPLYTAMSMYLEPKWGGQPGDVERFAADIRTRLGGDLGDGVYFRIACGEALDLGDDFFNATGFQYKDLLPGIRVVLRDHPQNPYFFNHACHMACLADDKDLAALLLERIDPATHYRFVWGDYSGVERWRRAVDPRSYQGEDRATLTTESGWVRGVAFLNDNNRLLSGGYVPFFDLWDLVTNKPLDRFEAKNHVRVMAIDAAASQVIVGIGDEQSPDSQAVVYELKGEHQAQILKGHSGSVVGVAISRDGSRYGTAARDNTAKIWNRADLAKPLTLKHPEWVYDIAFSPDGKVAATASYKGGVWLWNAETGEPVGEPLVKMNSGPWQCKLAFVPSTKALITASADGTIRRWNLATRKFQQVKPGGDNVFGLAVSPDGKWLAVGCSNGQVDVLSVEPLKVLHSYRGHHSNTQAVAFSPDGKTLASGSDDATIKLWSLDKLHAPQPRAVIIVHQAADGVVFLKAADAKLHGDKIAYVSGDKNCIGFWRDQQDWVEWDVQIDKPGKFEVAVTTACAKGIAGSEYVVAAGSEKLAGKVKETGDWETFARETLGTIEISQAGRTSVAVKVTSKPGPTVMNLRLIELRPEK